MAWKVMLFSGGYLEYRFSFGEDTPIYHAFEGSNPER